MAAKKEPQAKTETQGREYFFPTLGVTVVAATEEEALTLAEAKKKEEAGDGDS